MKFTIFIVLLLTSLQLTAKDYCTHPKVKPLVEKLHKSLPIRVDSATVIYSFACIDSTYIYYVAMDTKQYTKKELEASYKFDKGQADSTYKKSKGKLHVKYIYHKLDGSLLHEVKGK